MGDFDKRFTEISLSISVFYSFQRFSVAIEIILNWKLGELGIF
jgi:hypothetical protein